MFREIDGDATEWFYRDEAGQMPEPRFDISPEGLDREFELARRRVMAHVDWRIIIEKYLGGLNNRTFYEPVEYSKEFKEALDKIVQEAIEAYPLDKIIRYTWF